MLLGDTDAWEPESIWLSLERAGVTLAPGVQDKVSAARTGVISGAFYWDPIVFVRTASALAGHGTDTDCLDEPELADVCAAVELVAQMRKDAGHELLDWGSGPPALTAVLLHRAGVVLPPAVLDFARDAAAHLQPDTALRDKVEVEWKKLADSKDLAEYPFPETEVGVQLARLAGIELHARERRKVEREQRARLHALHDGASHAPYVEQTT